MPIHFACPRCSAPLSVAARKAGATVPCPACDQLILVPAPAGDPLPGIPLSVEPADEPPPPEVSAPRADYDDPFPVRRRRKRGPGAGVLVAFGLLGVVALVMVVAAVLRHDRAAAERPGPKPADRRAAEAGPRADREPAERPVRRDNSDAEGTQVAGWLVALYVAVTLYVFLSLLLAVWVVRDARNRSVDNGFLWMLLIFPFNAVGLLIYLASRPHGSLVGCERCGNRRLAFVGVCPHCRRPVRAYGRVR